MSMNLNTSISPKNAIKFVLLDPGTKSANIREDIAGKAFGVKVQSFGFGAGGVALGTYGWFEKDRSPILGTVFFLAGLIVALVSREVFTVASNTEKIVSGNLAQRTKYAVTIDSLVNQALKDTYIVKPVFGNFIKRELRKKAEE